MSRGGSRTAANIQDGALCFKPLTIITKSKPFTIITNSSILDVAAVLDPPLMSTFNYYEINMKRLITIPRYSTVLTLTKIQSKF